MLASTVAAVLGRPTAQRVHGDLSVVRADVYRSIFDALGIADLFEVARAVLEDGHPQSVLLHAPWPPGWEPSPDP